MRSWSLLSTTHTFGVCNKAEISSLISKPFFCARKIASIQSVSTCVAKAFVLATPFSMPARVSKLKCARRTMLELSTLQIAKVFGDEINQKAIKSLSFQSILSTLKKASWGKFTLPMAFIRFLPSFCFSSNFRLRVMSPP